MIDDISVGIEHDEGRNAADTKLGAKSFGRRAIRELQGRPRHRFVVVTKRIVVFVRRHEDNFQSARIAARKGLVELSRDGSEAAAWWAPVSCVGRGEEVC